MPQKLLQKAQFKKIAEATGDLIGNKNDDKSASVSKQFPKELYAQMRMKQTYQKKDIYLQKKDNKLLMN